MKLLKEIELNSTSYNFPWKVCLLKKYYMNKYAKQETISWHDTSALFGMLYRLVTTNKEILNSNLFEILDNASICDNNLYLNNFEGYYITDRIKIISIYLNQFDCCTALCLDIKKDKFFYCNV